MQIDMAVLKDVLGDLILGNIMLKSQLRMAEGAPAPAPVEHTDDTAPRPPSGT